MHWNFSPHIWTGIFTLTAALLTQIVGGVFAAHRASVERKEERRRRQSDRLLEQKRAACVRAMALLHAMEHGTPYEPREILDVEAELGLLDFRLLAAYGAAAALDDGDPRLGEKISMFQTVALQSLDMWPSAGEFEDATDYFAGRTPSKGLTRRWRVLKHVTGHGSRIRVASRPEPTATPSLDDSKPVPSS